MSEYEEFLSAYYSWLGDDEDTDDAWIEFHEYLEELKEKVEWE